jgi:hypothetical protein
VTPVCQDHPAVRYLQSKGRIRFLSLERGAGWRWRSGSLDLMLSKFPHLKFRSYVELRECALSQLSNLSTHSDQLQRQLLEPRAGIGRKKTLLARQRKATEKDHFIP